MYITALFTFAECRHLIMNLSLNLNWKMRRAKQQEHKTLSQLESDQILQSLMPSLSPLNKTH